jgi:hypothetical protein
MFKGADVVRDIKTDMVICFGVASTGKPERRTDQIQERIQGGQLGNRSEPVVCRMSKMIDVSMWIDSLFEVLWLSGGLRYREVPVVDQG